MVIKENRIFLSGGDSFITQQKMTAYKVTQGTVLVYIVPYANEKPGRRSFLTEVRTGGMIPAFSYQDPEYRQWRFCLSAMESASLMSIENGSTSVLRQRFAETLPLSSYGIEDFENSLVDFYETSIVSEDALIHKTQQQKKTVYENTFKLIFNVFRKDAFTIQEGKSVNPLYNAVRMLCDYMKIPIASLSKMEECCGKTFTVADIARVSHFAYREIVLEDGWQKRDSGPLLAFDKENNPYICLPKGSSSYIAVNAQTGQRQHVDAKLAENMAIKGFMLYRPFPSSKMTSKSLLRYCLGTIRTSDVVSLLIFTLLGALIGILLPTLNQQIYDTFIPLGENSLLIQISCVIASFMIGNIFFAVVKNLSSFRLVSRMSYQVQDASYDRLFNLPESFFRQYESADLAQRAMGIRGIVSVWASFAISSVVILITAVVYFCKMMQYSWLLGLVSLAMILVYGGVTYCISAKTVRYEEESARLSGVSASKLYQFLNGIAKIRIAGVENRALYEYLKPFTQTRRVERKIGLIRLAGEVIALASETLFAIILYIVMIYGNLSLSVGSFIAFSAAFGAFSSAIMQLVDGLLGLNETKPLFRRAKPILEAEPEFDDAKELPGEISGEIEINNVSFSYGKDSPPVLNQISLKIKPGEYIGLVGPSGCGKSTLLKLLLGFEQPSSGRIYYDGKDIDNLDKRELRKKIGIVLQDGNLISGSIFENITITAPNATTEDVKKVIRAVGLEQDINDMPMGLHTILSEDCGTISGGQQQRILIARAIIGNPRILFFDEATSALDNVTQSMVCDTLEQMNSTRIIIAHRLSTIIHCDRILVLDNGSIAEEGTYEQLMERQGLFYTLASRQLS